MDSWRLLFHPDLPGSTQMAIDEALYLLAETGCRPALRFYTWQNPTLSLGFFQHYKRVVRESFIVHNKIDVVRRITGGRAVLHHDEVTYAVAAPLMNRFANLSLKETYRLIAHSLNRGLELLGIDRAVFSGTTPDPLSESRLSQCFVSVSQYEVSRNAKKIIGSAQKRSSDRFLQHGSILLGFDAPLQNGCILTPDPDMERKVAPLNVLVGRRLSVTEVVDCFRTAFAEELQIKIEPSELTKQEWNLVRSLEPVYQSAEWTQSRCR